MAVNTFHSSKLIFLHFLTISLIFLLVLIPFATPLSFNFPSFTFDNNRIAYDRAYAFNNVIVLTPNTSRGFGVGRATYYQPLQLWDKLSGKLTDFTSNFSFVIDSQTRPTYGDGMAFFLMAADGKIDLNGVMGGQLGLGNEAETGIPFVAVEFDAYQNFRYDDPPYTHVGIDINNTNSTRYAPWNSSIVDGRTNDAWINYNSSSRNLTVVFTGYMGNTSFIQNSISYIVDLRDCLPELVSIGFSAATGSAYALHTLLSWNFSSNLEIDKSPMPVSPISSPDEAEPTNNNKTALAIGLGVGGCVVVGVLGLVLFGLWKKRKSWGNEDNDPIIDGSMEEEFEKGTGPKKFSYNELARATNYFAKEEKLGEGGFGGVYGGFIKDLNSYVAVKRVSRGSKQGIKEYAAEVKIISRLRHRNLVQLIGWCHEKRELLLVYEFMSNGSLDTHLFKAKDLLPWEVRYKIAQGLASSLLYLHEEWEQCVVHRDIKSSNIMLDSEFNAKLGDFGLARLVDHGKESQTTVLAGTIGYMAPDYLTTGKASKESDVYSFGIVALEIVCGRKPIKHDAEESQISMVNWVWELYGIGKFLEAADSRLCGDFNEQQMERLMIVGLWCAHPDSKLRPPIRQAIHVLNFEAPLPILPSKMPVATYFAPLVNTPTSSFSLSYGTTASDKAQIQSSFSLEHAQTQSSSYSNHANSSEFTTSSAASSSASLLHTL